MMIDEFRANAVKEPDALALVGPNLRSSRGELLRRSLDLASLLQTRGIERGDRVLVGVGSSPEFVEVTLALWSLGSSVVPIDLKDPESRLAMVADDTAAKAVVTVEPDLPTPLGPSTTLGDHLGISVAKTASRSRRAVPRAVEPASQEAYVIFTSGSTGRPKGVSISHRALTSYLGEASRLYGRGRSGLIFPFQLPVTFDASITSWALPLYSGGVCHVIGTTQPSWALGQFLRATTDPCVVKTTPSQLRVLAHLLGNLDDHELSRLTIDFVVGGEQLLYEDCVWAANIQGVKFYNEYGPTEATVGCIVQPFSASSDLVGPVPIGYPHGSVKLHLQPTAEDSGLFNLTLSGPCLADGYLASQSGGFHEVCGERRYATGDLVRRRADEALVFVGRDDEQVKISGHRVDLGEVEQAGRDAAPGARVVALEREGSVWLVVDETSCDEVQTITEGVRRRVPRYMWPRRVVPVPALPLTEHGKVDKRALAAMLFRGVD